MARLLGTRAQDWPERAKGAGQTWRAAEGELSRLCARADALSAEIYSYMLPSYVREWERTGRPIPKRGASFAPFEGKLRSLCGRARARLSAACGDGPEVEAARAFIDRLESGGFANLAEMDEARRSAVEEMKGAVLAPRDHEEV